jgi:hypothetical protein
MAAHSFLPPSGASAWLRCAQWPTMNALYPQDDSPESIEGTAAHWVGTELIAGRVHSEGSCAPNGPIVTGEMVDGAELLRDTVAARMPGLQLHIEEKIAATQIHPLCFGTPDVWARTGASKRIEIVDYKFGHGFVDEWFNSQLMTYLAAIIEKEFDPARIPTDIIVAFTIVQPRCYHRGAPVRTHEFSIKEIQPYMIALRDAATAATQPNPPATTNPECVYCPGRHACSALQRAAYSDAEFADARQPHDIPLPAAALELRMLERAYERLGARVDGLRELILANLRAGQPVPHYKLEAGRGRAQWTITPEQLITVGQLLEKDLSKPGVVTPAQAKKIGVDDSVISAYSEITSGSLKLVQQNNSDIRRVFTSNGE